MRKEDNGGKARGAEWRGVTKERQHEGSMKRGQEDEQTKAKKEGGGQ